MKKFNINSGIYIQITKEGWKYLRNTVGDDYIKHCIQSPFYERVINGEVWYRLQCHQVFDLFTPITSGLIKFNSNIMIDDESITSYIEE